VNISLTDLELEAFRNFTKTTSVSLGALPPGLYAVRGLNRDNPRLGPNGCGKSTLFSDAPTWCLYGRTTEGLRTTDLKSWTAGKAARVKASFIIGKDEHVIQRGPRASDLAVDGKIVGQAEVDALIGMPEAAWGQAIVWGQGRPLFFDLAPRDKMALLSDASGLERWERRAEAAGDRARRMEAARDQAGGRLAGLEIARKRAQDAVLGARARAEEWGAERATRLGELASTAAAGRARARNLEGRRGEAAMAADRAGLDARQLREAMITRRAARDALAQSARDGGRALEGAREELAEVVTQLQSFAESGECPTCGQPVRKADADKHIKALEARRAKLRGSISDLKKSAVTETREAASASDELEADEKRLRELEHAEGQAESEQRSLDRALAVAQAEASAAERGVAEAEAEENPHREAAQAARREEASLRAEIKECEARVVKLGAAVERAQFWAKGFREIRLGIIDEVLDDLRETTAAVLEDLGLGEWSVDYATERETKSGSVQRALTVTLRSPTAPEGVRWEVYSGGERQRLRLAGALALSEVLLAHSGAQIDFRVLDEPTRGLSSEGVRDLTEMLATYAAEAKVRLFLIDHMVVESTAFAGIITIIAERGGARIEVAS
jgi:DNA repair exonuclease SbcCD ATPase subunit